MSALVGTGAQGGFVRSVSVLAGGTALAQGIGVVSLPVLTRIYSPVDFDLHAVFSGLLGITSIAACLRFDVAVPVPASDEDAANVLSLALLSSVAFAAISAVVVLVMGPAIGVLLREPRIVPYLWLLPIGILSAGAYSALQFWATRKGAFAAVAGTRLTQAAGGTLVQVAAGFAVAGPLGLMVGQVVKSGAGVLKLARRAMADDAGALRAVSISAMRRLFKVYDQYPKFSTLESLASAAAYQVPVIFIAAIAAGPEAGFLFLGMRVMYLPTRLVGSSVLQVYLSHAADHFRAGTLGGFTARVLGGLLRTGVGPLLFAGLVAPASFALIFGSEWRRAGVIVAWMTPALVFQFLAGPVSMSLNVANRQRTALWLQVYGFVLRMVAVTVFGVYAAEYLSEAYVISGAIFYLTYLIVLFKVVDVPSDAMLLEVRRGMLPLGLWLAAGLTMLGLLSMVS